MVKFTATKATEKKKEFNMSQEEKIRRGQAFNLAVSAAIQDGKPNDKKEIFAYFTFYYELSKLAQTYSIDEIQEYIK